MSGRSGVLSRARAKVRRGDGGRPTFDYIQIILKDPCTYCGEFGCDSVDHIVPRSKRDKLETGYGVDHFTNLAPCHKRCNELKGDRGVFV